MRKSMLLVYNRDMRMDRFNHWLHQFVHHDGSGIQFNVQELLRMLNALKNVHR